MKSLDQFLGFQIEGSDKVTGGGNCKIVISKGNNGIGQEKRGELDGPPPGLAAQKRQDFYDQSGNRHGVEV